MWVAPDLVWLLGQPHLSDYLAVRRDKVRRRTRDRSAQARRRMARRQRSLLRLEQSEAGIADTIDCLPLDPALAPLAARIRANPWFKDSFDNLPVAFRAGRARQAGRLAEPCRARLHRRARAALGADPDAGRACSASACRSSGRCRRCGVQRLTGDRFVFSCPSTDFRAHHPSLLRPEQLKGITIRN